MKRPFTILALVAAMAAITLPAARPVLAAPIKTTQCKAAPDKTVNRDGKTYQCTGCETCTTTTCQEGPASCTKETTTSCSCTEVAAGPRPGAGDVYSGPSGGVLDPGPRAQSPRKYSSPGQMYQKK